jgi:myosin heavy subunit
MATQTVVPQAAPPIQPPPPVQQAPHPQQAPAQNADDEDIQPEPVEINEALIQLLVDMDKEISSLESRNVSKQYQLKSDQMKRLATQVQAMVQEQQALVQQTQKEYQDVVNLQTMQSTRQMMTQGQYTAQMSKEQEEYMQALSKQEVHKKELDATSRQLEAYKREVASLKTESDRVKELYDKQDGILGETISSFSQDKILDTTSTFSSVIFSVKTIYWYNIRIT